MGRQKTYDREQVTQAAMKLFWEQGFHATTTRDLAEAMGVNPYSLFAEFGSKEELYRAALERYDAVVVTRNFGRLEAEDAGLEDVLHVIDFFGNAGARQASALGCLMCNTSTERAPTVAISREVTSRFVARVTAAFSNALRRAAARGQVVPDAPVDALAAFAVTHLMGVFVLMRARVNPAILRAAADQALERVNAFAARQ